jgi:hypothetical protein
MGMIDFLCLTAILPPHGLASWCTIGLASWPPSSSFGIMSFFWHLEHYHLLLALRVPSSSFGLANAITMYFFVGFTVVPLWAVVSSILPHRHAPLALDNIIFYMAPLAIFSSILPHGHAPPAILFFIQPNGHAILAKYFFIWPHSCTSPGKILLITHQGFFL